MGRWAPLSLWGALLATTGCNGTFAGAPPVAHPTTVPGTPIQHIVILLQENRSFNNLFAGFPGADTAMSGPCSGQHRWCKPGRQVQLHVVRLHTGPPNRGTDISHSHRAFLRECDADAGGNCRMDGFDSIGFGESGELGPAKLYPYAYVDRAETAPYWRLAQRYTIADRMFSTDTASSFIAHQQVIAGTARWDGFAELTDQPNIPLWGCDAPGKHHEPGQLTFTPLLYKNGRTNLYGPFPCFTQYETMADLLDRARLSYNFYVERSPNPVGDFSGAVWNGFDAIKNFRYGPDWHEHVSIPNRNIFRDIQNGKLAAMSWVIPSLYDSDHPVSGCDGGPWWVTKVVNAIGTSRYWNSTAVLIAWDDWGGWYDNVAPPQVNYHSLGFRIPLLIVSPYAKPHHVSHTEYNYGSLLRFVEETFELGSLGTTDASANSIADSFDFHQRPLGFEKAPLPHAHSCADKITNPGAMEEIIEHDGGVPD